MEGRAEEAKIALADSGGLAIMACLVAAYLLIGGRTPAQFTRIPA